ncbi:MAG: ferritin-like domain-containing protein, partial [Pseudomonadota bacterium]
IQGQFDAIGERARKLGGDTLTSIGSVTQHTQIKDQDSATLSAEKMIAELRDDNAKMIERLKAMKPLAEEAGDNATDGLIDDWTDAAEERVWFLSSLLK